MTNKIFKSIGFGLACAAIKNSYSALIAGLPMGPKEEAERLSILGGNYRINHLTINGWDKDCN